VTEQIYICPIEGCDASFKTKRGLNYHIIHAHGYYCEQCNRLFNSKSQLHNHRLAVHGVGE